MNSLSVTNFKNNKKILLSREANGLTIEQARQSGMIMEFLEKINKTQLVATIAQMISEFLTTQLNDLTSSQVLDVAETIVYSCKGWTPDDVLLILRNGRDGKYKNDNARWTLQTFNRWADEYETERSNIIINKHLETKDSNGCNEDNKKQLYKERQGTIGDIKLPPKKVGDVAPSESYFYPPE